MFFTRPTPTLLLRDFPLGLRKEWRCDRPNPRLGRRRALAFIASRPQTVRPAPYWIAAE